MNIKQDNKVTIKAQRAADRVENIAIVAVATGGLGAIPAVLSSAAAVVPVGGTALSSAIGAVYGHFTAKEEIRKEKQGNSGLTK